MGQDIQLKKYQEQIKMAEPEVTDPAKVAMVTGFP